jgi:hypothetical protein
MRETEKNPTTPTRRSTMFSLAALTAGLSLPAIAAVATNPDQGLVALQDELRSLIARTREMEAAGGLPDYVYEPLGNCRYAILDNAADIQAVTLAGIRLKLAMLRDDMALIGSDRPEANDHFNLLNSLLADIWRLA